MHIKLPYSKPNNFDCLLKNYTTIEIDNIWCSVLSTSIMNTIPFVFKGSFKKANRSRIDSFSGIGDEKALKILRKIVGKTKSR